MPGRLYQVKGVMITRGKEIEFCAGIILMRGKVTHSAPILKMVGWNRSLVNNKILRSGWVVYDYERQKWETSI